MKFIADELARDLLILDQAFPYRRDAKHFIKFVDALDFLASVHRWLVSPWSLYVAVGANTSFELDVPVVEELNWMLKPEFNVLLNQMWLQAVYQQPNDLLTEVAIILTKAQAASKKPEVASGFDFMYLLIKLIREHKTFANWAYSISYPEYLNSGSWALVRLAACQKANWRCQMCNSPKSLNVHHNCYDRGHEKPSDLLVLCRACHAKHHDKLPDPSSVTSKFNTPPRPRRIT